MIVPTTKKVTVCETGQPDEAKNTPVEHLVLFNVITSELNT